MFLVSILQELILSVSVFLASAFLTVYERKVLGLSQLRKGPNKVSLMGVFQPFSDALKLITKTFFWPSFLPSFFFVFSPVSFLVLSLLLFESFPFLKEDSKFIQSGLWILLVFSLSAYGPIFSGWVSFSKFSWLGSVRSVAQSVSFEILLAFTLFSLFAFIGNFSVSFFSSFNCWFVFSFLLTSLILLFSLLAEGGRAPFDLPEGESELVSGYSVEYGSVTYTCLFLSETISMYFFSWIYSSIFLGSVSFFKIVFILSGMIFFRSCYPRIRYDFLMFLSWVQLTPLVFIPFCLSMILI